MTANLSITTKKRRGKSIPRDSSLEADPQDRGRLGLAAPFLTRQRQEFDKGDEPIRPWTCLLPDKPPLGALS